ncbi:M20/M25/M40 family metallo-hydrolase [Streptomyces sp. NPDC050287]|uniref:M20/M25/M40 family metallo-hydrolase n=1 Tax=Streptomyces sp. NPDC050287 TaxID=3365608 RepID=UPI0037B0901F
MTQAHPHDSHAPDDIDVLSLARTMIRYDTSHNGEGADTLPLARTLERVWRHAGVATEIIETPKPGNVHFLARIPGTGEREPLLVLSHSDVVPARPEDWRHPPFAAEETDGFLWGRGSLDMKGAGAAFMNALLRHVREGTRFDRDIIFLSDCDEEGGWYGTRWLTEHHWHRVAAGAVLTEGGWTLADQDGVTPMLASLTCLDRTFGAVRLTASGTATHSSRPLPDSAIARLAEVVHALSRIRLPVVLTPLNRDYFTALSQGTRDPALTAAIKRLLDVDEAAGPARDRSPAGTADHAVDRAELDTAAQEVLSRSPYPGLHEALLRATVAFVAQDGGLRANVIPGRASALLQLRFTPGGQSPQEVLDHLGGVVSAYPGIRMDLVGPPGEPPDDTLARWNRDWSARPSPIDSDVFTAWRQAVALTHPGVPAVPALFEGGTSGKPWQDRGVPVYGMYPYVVDNATLTAMHGHDERVRVSALRQGAELAYRMFRSFSVHKPHRGSGITYAAEPRGTGEDRPAGELT